MQRTIKMMIKTNLQEKNQQANQAKLAHNQKGNQSQDLHHQRKSFLLKKINLMKERKRGKKRKINKTKNIK